MILIDFIEEFLTAGVVCLEEFLEHIVLLFELFLVSLHALVLLLNVFVEENRSAIHHSSRVHSICVGSVAAELGCSVLVFVVREIREILHYFSLKFLIV